MHKLHTTNIDNVQGKLHYIVVVRYNFLTTDAYNTSNNIAEKIKMHNISDVLNIMNKMYCHYYTTLMTKI